VTLMNVAFSKYDLLEIIFRHKLKIVFIPLFFMVMTIAVILFFPRKYRSEAKLFLQVGRQSLGIDATANLGSAASLIQNNRDEEVKSALQVVGSRGVISQVVQKLTPEYILTGTSTDSEDNESNSVIKELQDTIGRVLSVLKSIDPISPDEEAVIKIEEGLKISAERNSMVLTATFDAKSPKVAQNVLDALIEVYQDEHLRIHRNGQAGGFLSEQRDILLKKYSDAQEEVKNTKNEFAISSVDGRRASLEARLQAIEMEKIQNIQNLTTSRAKMNELKTQLASMPERETSSKKSVPNAGADLLRKELYISEIRMMDLKSRLAADHPQLIATYKQVEEARKMVEAQENDRKETVDDISPIYRALSLDLRQQESIVAGLDARQKELLFQHEEILAEMECFNRQAIQLTQLEHSEQIARDKYLQYTNSLEQALSDEALEDKRISSVSIVQKATVAERPVTPSKLIVLLAGVMISMTSVFGLILVSEKLNDRIRSESDLASILGLPVLATIPDSADNRRVLIR
jgi:polysaccharide biosynthesis protein PslE